MLNILHFVIDDKFIDGAISLFESDKRIKNTYAIIRHNDDNFKYIKYSDILKLDVIDVVGFSRSFDVVVLHALGSLPLPIICKIPQNIKVVWFAWGYDIYNEYLVNIQLYAPLTLSYIKRGSKLFKKHYRKYFLSKLFLKKTISRIDYFSGVFPYEYELIKQFRNEFRAAPLDFYYGSTSFFVPEQPFLEIEHDKKDILIGNSADPANNHLDVLDLLKNVDMPEDARLIIPLSYYNSVDYISTIEKEANNVAPGRVLILRKFLPLNEYINLISRCKVAIFAHERQQATDNIFMQLLYGARVYMSETSLAYHYLKDLGINVYSLQNDLNLINFELKDDEIITNRRIISNHYSSSKLIKRINVIVDHLLNL